MSSRKSVEFIHYDGPWDVYDDWRVERLIDDENGLSIYLNGDVRGENKNRGFMFVFEYNLGYRNFNEGHLVLRWDYEIVGKNYRLLNNRHL